MNPGNVGLVKIAAVVFSSTLAAVFVYDRATGGAFYGRLTTPSPNADAIVAPPAGSPSENSDASAPAMLMSGSKRGDITTYGSVVSRAESIQEPGRPAPGGVPEYAPPTILLSGSKSDAIGMTIAAGTLQLTSPGNTAQSTPQIPNANHNRPPPMLMSGSKTFILAPLPAPVANAPQSAGNNNARPQPAGVAPAPNPSPPPAAPPSAAQSSAAQSSATPSRPNTIMMGTKSAPVFTLPMQQSALVPGPTHPSGSQPQMQTARQPAANGPGRQPPPYVPPRQSGAPRSRQPNPGNAGAIRDF
jgi:hypothetical protein